ncbi:cysteine-rich repeat secretory protein 3-like [Thalictrum thalictroides]|uniref:Cysteine-rich repeat secretory protein 3-like n=1 Tax=Thalictrum thalictroides TaxID=46969 RepID=A0A7J6X9F3_THATH|nr:cysteine-rich repeat secretory protein 3-like [Thalictrum thalictroides]
MFLLTTVLVFLPSYKTASDYTSLVYSNCAKQSFADSSGIYSKTLSSLFDSVVSQSSKTKFFKTSSSSESQTNSISALFQCRGDLSNGDCYNCVNKLPYILSNSCGETISGRIQLLGCYIHYELNGSPQISSFDQLLYKTCSAAQDVGSSFEDRKEASFAALERGIVSGSGFYTASYELVYVLGQCEGDLGTGACGECVKSAVQKAQVECGSSISGQIYLQKCFISYSYFPSGISRKSYSEEARQNSGRTVALAVGATAGVVLGIMFLMFIKSLMKKHDDHFRGRRTMYPRVKVRIQEEEPEKDQYEVQKENSSLMLLNNFNSPSSHDHLLTGNEFASGSPSPVARIPKSYVPSFTTPSISSSKGKNDKEIEDKRPNIRASSVPPPRAVLSSPDNDGIIGNRNQLTGERRTIMKRSNLGECTDSQEKVNTRILKAKDSTKMKTGSKETVNNKNRLKLKQSPELTVTKQSGYLRKGRQKSTENSSSTILSRS